MFDYDFFRRAALKSRNDQPARTLVTLVWHLDDILDVYASQFQAEASYAPLEFPANSIWTAQNSAVFSEDV